MSLRPIEPPRGGQPSNGADHSRRARHPADAERPSLVEVAKTAAEDLVDLVGAQVKLARLELTEDLHQGVSRIALVMVFVPPIVVGYAFGMAALASWLADYWGRSLALAAVAGLQVVGGGIGVAWAASRLRRVQLLRRTSMEAADSVRSIAAVSDHAGLSSPPAHPSKRLSDDR